MTNTINNISEFWDEYYHTIYGKYINMTYEKYKFTDFDDAFNEDHVLTSNIIDENKESIKRKRYCNIGCGHGMLEWYIKDKVVPSWFVTGIDFSHYVITMNIKRYSDGGSQTGSAVKWDLRDILNKPLKQDPTYFHEDFGVIACLKTLQYFNPLEQDKIMSNLIDHSEHLIISVLNAFDETSYNVIWKQELAQDYKLLLIKGKLN